MRAAPSLTTEELAGLVDGLKQEWRAGAALADAAGAYRDIPALARHRSLFVDLAYEDYCLQEEAGAAPDVESFCRRLPAFRSHVREVLRGHRDFADNPDLFSAPAVTWPEPGDTIERLQLRRELGRGAFARVFLAHDPDANRLVALKLAPTPSLEAGTLGPLRHPHIGGIHWARPTAGNLHALCMPFVGTATLADVIDAAFHQGRPTRARTILEAAAGDEALPPVVDAWMSFARAVAAIGARLADALAHLHAAGIAHGDLKPSNVLVGSGGHPYLIDFNLADGPGSSRLRCGGTLPYMAPERVRLLIDPASGPADPIPADVYGLGALLFEMLTGRVPIEPLASLDQTAVAADLVSRTPPRVRAIHPGMPSRLARLVDRCLSVDPARRPTAAELARRLAGVARRPSFVPPAIGAVLVGVGLFASIRAGTIDRPTPEFAAAAELPTPEPTSEAEPRTPEDFFARGLKFLEQGKFGRAWSDFMDAQADRPGGRAAAYAAYCKAQDGKYQAAVELFTAALAADGYDAAWARNDLAYCILRLKAEPAQLTRAHQEARRALTLAPGLKPARYTLARVEYAIDLDRNTAKLTSTRCRETLTEALKGTTPTADQYLFRAQVRTACAGGRATADPEPILADLRSAVAAGYPSLTLARDQVLSRRLGGLPAFQAFTVPAGAPAGAPTIFGLLPPAD